MTVEDMATLRDALGTVAARFHAQVAAAGGTQDPSGMVALAAATVMQAAGAGHTCLTLDSIVERVIELQLGAFSAADLTAAIEAHPWVELGDGSMPLVFEYDRLYLRRYREAEVRLARALLAAAPERFELVTGGPGTGKTTSAARLIADLVAKNPTVRIALAAPTGKAATRLGEAIEVAWEREGLAHLKEKVSVAGRTLHRLLGYSPTTDSFRRGPTDPLEHDVVIVDEASMVPLLLMDALFESLRPSARLILLGDHDQLASVEAGSVLADIVRVADGGPLERAVKRLTTSHRFDETKGIGALARAIRDGDADAALSAMHSNDGSVQHVAQPSGDDSWLEEFAMLAGPVFDAESPEAAIARLGQVRILCATNVGPAGTTAITVRAEQVLRTRGRNVSGRNYRGRPLLITRNDYTLDLFNGDVGVVWDTIEDGERIERAFVSGQADAGRARGFPLPQLPEAVTAWAMSIHKSQGSEFDTVYVVLPDRDTRVLSRELLYTAVTRAKSKVVLVGSAETLRNAIGKTARRESGLGYRLT